MVKIRLKRMGMKKMPFYRLVVTDSRNPRDGRFIEEIGHYNPLTDPIDLKIDQERAKYWLGVGAQPPIPCARCSRKAECCKSWLNW